VIVPDSITLCSFKFYPVSIVLNPFAFTCFALDGLTAFLIAGKTFFDFFSLELGGLLELEFDLVLLFSVGV